MKLKGRILLFLMASVLLVSSFAGCQSREEDPSTSGDSSAVDQEKPSGAEIEVVDHTADVIEKAEQNEDTVGWLQIPYSSISDVVVQSKKDNNVYLRLNFEKEYEFEGVYYADYRNEFGDGSREALPVNTVIYGHALTDDEESEKYEIRFAPLHDYRDINYAKENPYIQFSTGKENYMYEVVSVFVANNDNPDNPYNKGNAEPQEFVDMVKNEIIPRSIYDYGVEIADDDKFITLSTCIYVLDDGTATNYPNTYLRYAILGRLVDADAKLVSEKPDVKVNDDVVIDADGPIGSKKAA